MAPPSNWSIVRLAGFLVTDHGASAVSWSVTVQSSQTRLQDVVSHRIVFPDVNVVTPATTDGYFWVDVISDTDTDITPSGRQHKITLRRGGEVVQTWFAPIDHTAAAPLRFDDVSQAIVASGGTVRDVVWITSLEDFSDAPAVTGTSSLTNYFTRAETGAAVDAKAAAHLAAASPHTQYVLSSAMKLVDATDVTGAFPVVGKVLAVDSVGPTHFALVSPTAGAVTAVNGRVGAVTGLAEDSAVVHNAGVETIAGPKTFAVSPVVPTATTSGQAANLSNVTTAVAALVNSAPGTLDTLSEIATQLAADESAAAALVTVVGGKLAQAANLADLASPSTARASLGLALIAATGAAADLTGDPLPELASVAQTAPVGAPATLLRKITRFDTTVGAITQTLPSATAGAVLALGRGAGANPLTYTRAGTDVIDDGTGTTTTSRVVPLLAEVILLHCTTPGTWLIAGGYKSMASLDGRYPLDTAVVHLTGAETVTGVKTFSTSPIGPTPTTSSQLAPKGYVDTAVAGLAPIATSGAAADLVGDFLPEFAATAQTAPVGTPTTLLRKITRYDTTAGAITQVLPAATAGAVLALGKGASTGVLTYTRAGTDVIDDGTGTTTTSRTVPLLAEVVTLHCTTSGTWLIAGGYKSLASLDGRYMPITGGGGGGGAVTSVATRTGAVVLTKTDVGLSNVDDTPDASKPVSTAQAAALTAEAGRATSAESSLTTAVAGKAPTVHVHAEADVTSLVTDLAAKAVQKPIPASGWYMYTASAVSTATSASLTPGNLRLIPWYVERAMTINRIGTEVTLVGDAGSKFRLGIYSDNGACYPGALVIDAGQIAGDTVGVQELTISQALTPGLYWVGGAVQLATTTQPTLRTLNNWTPPVTLSPGTTAPGGTMLGYLQAAVPGTLPTTFTSAVSTSGAAARIFVKLA